MDSDELFPCRDEDGNDDHEWELVDDSFDHEFGTEIIRYFRCERCGETKEIGPRDLDDYDG
jgi:hypothetical protein